MLEVRAALSEVLNELYPGERGDLKKAINFWETSNEAIAIRRLYCPHCEGEFYEIDDHELDDCPICHKAIFDEPEILAWDSSTYTLIVDHKTGVPSIIRNDEYEPILRDSAPEETE